MCRTQIPKGPRDPPIIGLRPEIQHKRPRTGWKGIQNSSSAYSTPTVPSNPFKMHFSSALAVAVLLLAIHQSTAQLRTKDEREACMAQMMAAQQAETDKDLSDKLTKAHGTVDMVQALNADQKAKLVNTYFVGVCAPIKDFYNL